MALVYEHVRLDTNQIFYIGIELDSPRKKANGLRSKKTHGRNKFWLNIVGKTNYRINIVQDNLTNDEAKILEIKLIAFYGRRNLELGCLVNLTNGGDGAVGCIPSTETKFKISRALKGKIVSKETGIKISNAKKGNVNHKGINNPMYGNSSLKGVLNHNSKKVINIITNETWDCVTDCSEKNNIKKSTLTAWLNGQNKNKSNFRFL